MNDVTKINNLVEEHDLAFVILRTNASRPEMQPDGAKELHDTLAEGFKPFAVTSWMEVLPNKGIVNATAPQQIICEKIWFTKTRLVKPSPIVQIPNNC